MTNDAYGVSDTVEMNGPSHSYDNGVDGMTSNDSHTNDSHTNGHNGIDGHETNGVGDANGEPHMNGAGKHQNGQNGFTPPPSEEEKSIPIAICGMSLRLPGGLASPQDFWEFLLNKGDARGRVPESRYNVSAYHTETKQPGAIASEYGYFLDDSIKLGSLDTSRFSLSRAELEFADPQQRRLLEVVREAFDDAGDINFRVSRFLW